LEEWVQENIRKDLLIGISLLLFNLSLIKKRKERMCIVYNQLMRKEEKEIRVKV